MNTTQISVMATCRCHKHFQVPSELLVIGEEEKLAQYVVKLIDDEPELSGWEPESFGDETDIHLPDQDINICEVEGKITDVTVNGESIRCIRCSSTLDDCGFCQDETCPHSDWVQDVDIRVLSSVSLEDALARYGRSAMRTTEQEERQRRAASQARSALSVYTVEK